MRRDSGAPTAARISMERVRLSLFIGRHIIGVAIFVWLTVTCFQLKSPSLGYLMAVMTPIYAGFAFYSGQKLLRRYQALMEKYRAGGVRIAR
jgi:hypothetical protein